MKPKRLKLKLNSTGQVGRVHSARAVSKDINSNNLEVKSPILTKSERFSFSQGIKSPYLTNRNKSKLLSNDERLSIKTESKYCPNGNYQGNDMSTKEENNERGVFDVTPGNVTNIEDDDSSRKTKPKKGASKILTPKTKIFSLSNAFLLPPKYSMPKTKWWLFAVPDEGAVDIIPIYAKGCYMIGRNEALDVVVNGTSCSRRHAMLKIGLKKKRGGNVTDKVTLFLKDLSSSNGTFVNNMKIPALKCVELFDYDVIQFGKEDVQYVLLKNRTRKYFQRMVLKTLLLIC